VSGSTIFSSSMIEPGQPCVISIGMASACGERMWANWMSSPSISVMNRGSALSLASNSQS
jgi:hypothetical protein